MKRCIICDVIFESLRKDQVFCSESCRKEMYEIREFFRQKGHEYYRLGKKFVLKRRKPLLQEEKSTISTHTIPKYPSNQFQSLKAQNYRYKFKLELQSKEILKLKEELRALKKQLSPNNPFPLIIENIQNQFQDGLTLLEQERKSEKLRFREWLK